ncbi:Serine/arginine-rich splicing factor 1A [Lucilia cuprina]|nr:Serine/arginine-rich splicing factor 1A [Lucilia cuprina]
MEHIRIKDIDDFFRAFGKLVYIDVNHRANPVYALVQFDSARNAFNAVKARHGYDYEGYTLQLRLIENEVRKRRDATPPPPPPPMLSSNFGSQNNRGGSYNNNSNNNNRMGGNFSNNSNSYQSSSNNAQWSNMSQGMQQQQQNNRVNMPQQNMMDYQTNNRSNNMQQQNMMSFSFGNGGGRSNNMPQNTNNNRSNMQQQFSNTNRSNMQQQYSNTSNRSNMQQQQYSNSNRSNMQQSNMNNYSNMSQQNMMNYSNSNYSNFSQQQQQNMNMMDYSNNSSWNSGNNNNNNNMMMNNMGWNAGNNMSGGNNINPPNNYNYNSNNDPYARPGFEDNFTHGLSGSGRKWFNRYIRKGFSPEIARAKALEHRAQPYPRDNVNNNNNNNAINPIPNDPTNVALETIGNTLLSLLSTTPADNFNNGNQMMNWGGDNFQPGFNNSNIGNFDMSGPSSSGGNMMSQSPIRGQLPRNRVSRQTYLRSLDILKRLRGKREQSAKDKLSKKYHTQIVKDYEQYEKVIYDEVIIGTNTRHYNFIKSQKR